MRSVSSCSSYATAGWKSGKCSAVSQSSPALPWSRSFLSPRWDLSQNIFCERGKYQMRKKWKRACLLTLTLVIPFLSGCIYSHNYDKDGNEMNREQVEETIENIKDDVQNNFLRSGILDCTSGICYVMFRQKVMSSP